MLSSYTLEELIELRKNTKPLSSFTNSINSSSSSKPKLKLSDRFLVPPFSILDARQGYWRNRKKYWLDLCSNKDVDHGTNLLDLSATIVGITEPDEVTEWNYIRKCNRDKTPIPSNLIEKYREKLKSKSYTSTSTFDPVLCELAYRWFCPKGGKILDPFAGGDMQGIVAGCIGYSYTGVDLREKQIETNRNRKDELCNSADVKWVVGDSINICNLVPDKYDLILSNPPYSDLEVYSNDPRDLSTMKYDKFLEKYREIIKSCCSMLKDNRFVFFLVGEVRDKVTGNCKNFVSDTISAFLDCGLHLYNESILVTSISTLPIRVNEQFQNYRKLGKAHQNVLIFLKGDSSEATKYCGEVDLDNIELPSTCIPGIIALEDQPNEVIAIQSIPLIEVCLNCDIIKANAIRDDRPIPRMWIGTEYGWKSIDEEEELTYIVNNRPYLNKKLFPNASVPPLEKLPVKTIRR